MPEGSGPRLRTTRNLLERSLCSLTLSQRQNSWHPNRTPLLQLRERAHESAGDGKRGTCSPLHPKPQSQTLFARSQSQTLFARSDPVRSIDPFARSFADWHWRSGYTAFSRVGVFVLQACQFCPAWRACKSRPFPSASPRLKARRCGSERVRRKCRRAPSCAGPSAPTV